uniref:Uncharacterized protein n=1 Tax=Anguilla anguilla TaxID=7936 RepID=A0A0E9RC92_ANGAN
MGLVLTYHRCSAACEPESSMQAVASSSTELSECQKD